MLYSSLYGIGITTVSNLILEPNTKEASVFNFVVLGGVILFAMGILSFVKMDYKRQKAQNEEGPVDGEAGSCEKLG